MKMYIISEDEMHALEIIRKNLAIEYLKYNWMTNILWKIINKKRSFKWIIQRMFRKAEQY